MQTFQDLVHSSPTYSQVSAVLQLLVSQYPHLASEPLSIRDVPEFQDVYVDKTDSIEPAKDNSEEKDVNMKFPAEAPYRDPFETEKVIPSKLDGLQYRDDYSSHLKYEFKHLRERNQDVLEPVIHLRSLYYTQDGSPRTLEKLRDFIEKHTAEHPANVQVATHALRALTSAYTQMENPRLKQDCVEDGHFALILKLMSVNPQSCKLQVSGLDTFFHVMGSYGVDEFLPLPPNTERGRLINKLFHSVIKTTLLSLTTAPQHIDLQTLLKGMECVVKWYHNSMAPELQRYVGYCL